MIHIDVIEWLVIFSALTVTDVCWGYYINKVKEGKALPSAVWSVLLYLTGSIAVVGWVKDPWLLIPAAAGAFVGTYISVWLNKRKNENGP